MQMNNPIEVSFHNENPDDIFTQFIDKSDEQADKYDRRLIVNPVSMKFKYHKCN